MKDNKNSKNPIGIFDSGLGGLSVLKELRWLLPQENFIYYADTTYCPYGKKPTKIVIQRAETITQFLIKKRCKQIIVACNTATGAAISTLRNKYPLNFIGIEPATKPAAQYTQTGHIGILATENTFRTDHFLKTKHQHAKDVEVHIQPGDGLVELVETNQIDSQQSQVLLRRYLAPMIQKNIDALILGCTHFPFLMPVIKKIIPLTIKVFNPAPAVAKRAKTLLQKQHLMNQSSSSGQLTFYSSGDVKQLINFASQQHLY